MQTTFNSQRATRRDFIRKTAATTAVLAATPLLRRVAHGQAPAAGNVLGANNRIVVGFIGVGGQGMNAHVRIMKANAQANNVALAAVCDVWDKRIRAAKEFIE
ncbi:MAG: twin-arginine translocation signal domain-containing protein, partial [Verrucomicrobiales bacterium]|nr:twin-arginine translocation signal domain-containing protein [Verrucomicrobiales bacterium]